MNWARDDVVFSVATDSMEMYGSRLEEMRAERGPLGTLEAAATFERYLLGTGIDNMRELGHYDRKGVHNLKYYTWIEQQAKDVEELRQQWSNASYWDGLNPLADKIDVLINRFNERTGLLAKITGN